MGQQAIRKAIAALGTRLGPDVLERCRALFDGEQQLLAARVPVAASDCAYGPHERHRLDLYGGGAGTDLRPVLLFVHGGGFLMGDKGGEGRWPNAAVGRMAAERGWLGAVINYRLAPDHQWPAGSEDVLAAFDWLRDNAAQHGGDPERIVLIGTSAGAVHCAGALKLRPDLAARGLVLLSGLYGYTPLDGRDGLYYGEEALYPERMPREAVAGTGLPLLLACAQFDPPRFQAEWAGLIAERLERHGALPRCHYASGHNHYTMAMHLGTADRRLEGEIAAFVSDCCG
ncbi:alpha/beta hydrolase [Novosphingobium flavum]|uniref:Alpha/beta hydrolase n=1 Tax=Novosphingobium flavum TaxID=1778672 RepID=A0A7X1FTN8_9SPHN|nr:alpha/beta hydrolase [Novosphingobium flavum]MBC2666799.1 alpha/beta hydrolase [Novosphingobium flavum]